MKPPCSTRASRKRWRSGRSFKIGHDRPPRPISPILTTISVRARIRSPISPPASIPSPMCLRLQRIRWCWSEPARPRGMTGRRVLALAAKLATDFGAVKAD